MNDVSHVLTTQLPQQSELRHQSLTSSILNQLNQSLAHQLTTHVTTAKVTSDSTETAGHQKPAHTVNAMLMEKSDAARPNVPQWPHARRDKNDASNQLLMAAVTSLSAETSSVTVLSVTSSHQLANTMKTASHNKSPSAAVHTLVSATRASAASSVKLNAQKDTNKSSLHHMSVAQLPSVSSAITLQLHQPPPQLLQLLTPSQLSPSQSLSSIQSHQHQFVLIIRENHDAMVNNGA